MVMPGYVPPPATGYQPLSSVPDGPFSRVLVTGSRHWADEPAIRVALTRAWREAGQPIVVVHGACPTGADAIAAAWAAEHAPLGIREERHPARWEKYGHAAGPIRNQAMVGAGAWRVLAFPLGASPGTRGCMAAAEKVGLDVRDCAADGAIA